MAFELAALASAKLVLSASHELDGSQVKPLAPPPFQLRINHVSIIVKDADASLRFYRDLLGASPVNRPPFPFPGHWLWLGNLQLHLIQARPEDLVAASSAHVSRRTVSDVNHMAIQVADFEAAERYLQEAGVPVRSNFVPATVPGLPLLRQMFFPDPDGHYIELCECERLSPFVFGPSPASPAPPPSLRDVSSVSPDSFLLLMLGLFVWTRRPAAFPSSDLLFSTAASDLFLLLSSSPSSPSSTSVVESAASVYDHRRLAESLFRVACDPAPGSPQPPASFDTIAHRLPSAFSTSHLATSQSSSSNPVDAAAFRLLLSHQLADPNMARSLPPAFILISSLREDGTRSILFEDYFLVMTRLTIRLSSHAFLEAFASISEQDPSSSVLHVTFPQFLSLFDFS
ncbi:MAG: VOC family protein [archaeon]|nr:VOC family protein [archaeon]